MAVGLWMTFPLLGQEPALVGVDQNSLSTNQRVANTIADHLRQSGQLRYYTVDIVFRDGVAELSGTVADQLQREEVQRIVQGVPGVERVQDNLRLAEAVTQVQGLELAPQGPPTLSQAPTPTLPVAPAPVEPAPIYQAPPASPYDLNPPKMPPYAWPTYAPYNNYSRVAYPTRYPYQSWPYIGPFYPFPKIPPGWRSVKLEWQDGYWWYSPHSNSFCWWRIRYW
jgi:hypothetical protein